MKLRSMRRMIAELFFGEKEYDWNQLRLIPIFSLRAQCPVNHKNATLKNDNLA